MAVLTTYLKPSVLTPEIDVGMFAITERRTIDNSAANGGAFPGNGDNIALLTITRNCRLLGVDLLAKATLGAGATLKLQRNRAGARIDLTIATTAGAASAVNGTTIGCMDLLQDDVIEALVGGAAVTASAAIEVDLRVQH